MVKLLAGGVGGALFGAIVGGLVFLIRGGDAINGSTVLILALVGLLGGIGYGLFGHDESTVHRRFPW